MMISIEKNTMFVLIVVLASVCLTTTTVNAACAERPNDNNNATSDSAVDKVSNFFVDIGCTIKTGAERVKERVESGYNYLKSKITPDDMKNQTMIDDNTAPGTDGDRITFKEDDENAAMGGSLQATTPAAMHNPRNVPGKVDITDRTALIAPEFCAEGEVLVDSKCRKIVEI